MTLRQIFEDFHKYSDVYDPGDDNAVVVDVPDEGENVYVIGATDWCRLIHQLYQHVKAEEDAQGSRPK